VSTEIIPLPARPPAPSDDPLCWFKQRVSLTLALFASGNVTIAAPISIPIVPHVAPGASGFFGGRVDMHSHPACVHFSCEKVLVIDTRYEDVVAAKTQKLSNVNFPTGSYNVVIGENLPIPINFLSGCRKSGSWQKLITHLFYTAGHSSRIDREKSECGLTMLEFERAIAKKNVSAFDRFQITLSAFQRAIGDSPQFIRGALQGPSKASDEDGCNGGYRCTKYVEAGADFAERESNYVMAGALFCAFLCYFTYLVMRGRI
jgi:hypothetical protein